MPISTLVSNLDDVPEVLREHYQPVDSSDESAGFRLAIDDSGEKSKVKEFRTKNVNLMKEAEVSKRQLEELQKKFGGVDPDKYAKAMAALEQVQGDEERKLLEEGKFDEVFKQRTANLRDGFDQQLKAKMQSYEELEGKYKHLESSHSQLRVGQQLTQAIAGAKVKVRPTALEDVMMRTRNTFTLTDSGELQARDGKGQTIYGSKGDPLTMEEYVDSLTTKAPHLFESAGGGSASGGTRPAGGKLRIKPADIGKYADEVASGQVIVDTD
jgi:hypothetical protein